MSEIFFVAVNTGKADGSLVQTVQEVEPSSSSQAEFEENGKYIAVYLWFCICSCVPSYDDCLFFNLGRTLLCI